MWCGAVISENESEVMIWNWRQALLTNHLSIIFQFVKSYIDNLKAKMKYDDLATAMGRLIYWITETLLFREVSFVLGLFKKYQISSTEVRLRAHSSLYNATFAFNSTAF